MSVSSLLLAAPEGKLAAGMMIVIRHSGGGSEDSAGALDAEADAAGDEPGEVEADEPGDEDESGVPLLHPAMIPIINASVKMANRMRAAVFLRMCFSPSFYYFNQLRNSRTRNARPYILYPIPILIRHVVGAAIGRPSKTVLRNQLFIIFFSKIIQMDTTQTPLPTLT